MKIEVNGVPYTNFTSAVCTIRLDALSNSFSFDALTPAGQALPFKGGETCTILIDDEKVLTGTIEVVSVVYTDIEHTVTISGRDKTADLLDSTLDSIDDIRTDELTLEILIERIIDHLELDLKVIDEVNPKPFNSAEDLEAPEPGENAFKFIEKYARKRQVLLTSNSDGNIVITTNSGQTAEGAIQHIIAATDNNVMASEFSYDITGRYNVYKMFSELNPVALNAAGDTDLASVVNQSNSIIDNEVNKGRQLILISEISYSDGECKNRATWEANIRKARGLFYSATVPGFRVDGTSGNLWQINRLYQIVDDFVGKRESMLCNSVRFSLDVDEGRITTLGFVGQKAYTQFIEPDQYAEVAENVA